MSNEDYMAGHSDGYKEGLHDSGGFLPWWYILVPFFVGAALGVLL